MISIKYVGLDIHNAGSTNDIISRSDVMCLTLNEKCLDLILR